MKFRISVPSKKKTYILEDIIEVVIDRSEEIPSICLQNSLKKEYILNFSSNEELLEGEISEDLEVGCFKCSSLRIVG